jgi:hypothetical protein
MTRQPGQQPTGELAVSIDDLMASYRASPDDPSPCCEKRRTGDISGPASDA